MTTLTGKTALVVGASRGLGRGIALALDEAGAAVVAVARDPAALAELAAAGRAIAAESADAAREETAGKLIARYQPDVVVLVAGAVPAGMPLPDYTWAVFSRHWEADVKITFEWLKAALLAPLRPGSRVVVISSGAAVSGSPVSGGYAGAKATQQFIAAYAAEESRRAGLGLTVTSVLPAMSPDGAVGRAGIAAYAARAAVTEEQFAGQMGPPLTAALTGSAVLDLVAADASSLAPAYLLTAGGLRELPDRPRA
jgi:NAD(P)-dependent dehydrogenase (short-subunit alcohol dehydrogenase family)